MKGQEEPEHHVTLEGRQQQPGCARLFCFVFFSPFSFFFFLFHFFVFFLSFFLLSFFPFFFKVGKETNRRQEADLQGFRVVLKRL